MATQDFRGLLIAVFHHKADDLEVLPAVLADKILPAAGPEESRHELAPGARII